MNDNDKINYSKNEICNLNNEDQNVKENNLEKIYYFNIYDVELVV